MENITKSSNEELGFITPVECAIISITEMFRNSSAML